jgi:hypothetical protein
VNHRKRMSKLFARHRGNWRRLTRSGKTRRTWGAVFRVTYDMWMSRQDNPFIWDVEEYDQCQTK